MKKMIAILMLLMATTVSAENCRATLKHRNGQSMRSFTGFGYNRQEACRSASRECRFEQERHRYENRYNGSFCSVDRFPGQDPRPNRKNCSFDLVTRNGRVIQNFRSTDRNRLSACRTARQSCERDLSRRQRNGRNPRAYCKRSSRTDGGDMNRVTRSCMVTRINKRGRVMQSHTGSATARNAEQAKRRSCEKARQMCKSASRFGDRCISNRNNNYNDRLRNNNYDFLDFL